MTATVLNKGLGQAKPENSDSTKAWQYEAIVTLIYVEREQKGYFKHRNFQPSWVLQEMLKQGTDLTWLLAQTDQNES